MKIIVKAKTRARETKVEREEQPAMDFSSGKEKPSLVTYKVSVKEMPVNGKANEAIIKALAEYFDTAPSRIELISGGSSKQKIFNIE